MEDELVCWREASVEIWSFNVWARICYLRKASGSRHVASLLQSLCSWSLELELKHELDLFFIFSSQSEAIANNLFFEL